VRIVREPAPPRTCSSKRFWRAYRARARFDPSRSFGAWIRRIATNAALAQLRSMRRHPRWSDLDERAAAGASDRDLQEAIAIAFRSLPPDLLAVARLALIEQLPQAEIADALDVPIGTVKSRLFRAQRALARRAAPAGDSAMTDDDLARLLRAAIPPVDATGP
jgi:RNA polymerase sigma-70 factor (ECF subfamily)